MARLLAYPVRLDPNGAFATLEDGEEYYAQELAGLVMTEPGERPLVPEYGVEDPTFGEMDQLSIQSKVDMFGPPVELGDLELTEINENDLRYDLEFTVVEDDEEDDGEDEDEMVELEDDDYEDATEF